MFNFRYQASPGFLTTEQLQVALRRRSPLNHRKIVVSNAEVRQAIRDSGWRVMTAHRRNKLVKQLKAQKMSEQK